MCERSIESSSPLTTSSAGSRARTLAPPANESASTVSGPGFGANSSASLRRSSRAASSSKISTMPGASGCPCCGAPCGTSGMPLCQFNCRPVILGPSMSVGESSLLPTLTHQPYGSNRGGGAGRSGKWRPSLPTLLKSDTMSRGQHTGAGRPKRSLGTMAAHGKLPTLTRKGNYNRKGVSPTSGDGLATAIGGRLNPTWCEWFMGFPLGHTDVGCPIESRRSGTPSCRSKSNGSRVASSKRKRS